MAGAEEYAHHLYIKFSNPERLAEGRKMGDKIDVEAKRKFSKRRYAEGDILYHTKDIEWRAPTWQLKVLKTHLPHWAEPTRDLINKSAEIRRKKQNRNGWLKKLFPNFSVF